MKSTCEKNNWNTKKVESPLVWRELVDRGGRGTLLGGLNEFQEYAQSYYGVSIGQFMSDTSDLFSSISEENDGQFRIDGETKRKYLEENVRPFHLAIVGAENPSVYGVFPDLVSSKIFSGRNVFLRLITNDRSNLNNLKAIGMEIEDLASSQFQQIEVLLENDERNSYEKFDLVLIVEDFFQQQRQNYFHSLMMKKTRLKQEQDDGNLFEDERTPFEPEKFQFEVRDAFSRYKNLATNIRTSLKKNATILVAAATATMIATKAFVEVFQNTENLVLGLARNIENKAKARIAKKLQVDIQSSTKNCCFTCFSSTKSRFAFRFGQFAHHRRCQRRFHYRHQSLSSFRS